MKDAITAFGAIESKLNGTDPPTFFEYNNQQFTPIINLSSPHATVVLSLGENDTIKLCYIDFDGIVHDIMTIGKQNFFHSFRHLINHYAS